MSSPHSQCHSDKRDVGRKRHFSCCNPYLFFILLFSFQTMGIKCQSYNMRNHTGDGMSHSYKADTRAGLKFTYFQVALLLVSIITFIADTASGRLSNALLIIIVFNPNQSTGTDFS